jgi:hypothetical protein
VDLKTYESIKVESKNVLVNFLIKENMVHKWWFFCNMALLVKQLKGLVIRGSKKMYVNLIMDHATNFDPLLEEANAAAHRGLSIKCVSLRFLLTCRDICYGSCLHLSEVSLLISLAGVFSFCNEDVENNQGLHQCVSGACSEVSGILANFV